MFSKTLGAGLLALSLATAPVAASAAGERLEHRGERQDRRGERLERRGEAVEAATR